MYKLIAAAVLLAALAMGSACSAAPNLLIEPHSFQLADGSTLAADRGRFLVPEDRLNPESQTIEIGFLRLKSTNSRPGAPIVYLAGGPGGSGVAAASGPRQPIFLALRKVADVILLDQRGTGWSNRIPPCTADQVADPAAPLTEENFTAYYRSTLAKCTAEWQQAGIAIRGYTTEQSAQDLEDLRRALGARKIDLLGISYGTHLALAAMRRHPGSIGRVALASTEGMDQTVKLPRHVDAAFERADAALGGIGLPELIRRVHERFATPQPLVLKSPQGEIRFEADAFPLQIIAGVGAKNPEELSRLVSLYRALDAGHTAPAAAILYQFFLSKPLTITGMPEAMDIASGVSAARMARFDAEAKTAITGRALNFPMPQMRDGLPGLDLGDAFRREVRSSIPTLMLSGDLDVRTPLGEQDSAVAGLTRLHKVRVTNGGHDLFEAHPAIPGLLVDFFSGRRPTVRELRLPAPEAE